MDSGQHAKEQESGVLWSVGKLIIFVAFVLVLSWALRAFVFQAYEIPSGSMETTIMTDDLVFAEKVTYHMRDPQQGDIVTFEDPEVEGRVLIKRVIAVGGQTVDINDVDGLVYVDGVALDEDYTTGSSYTLDGSDVTFPYTVPEGYLWVMGDNRENSQDSRWFGAVPMDSVTARAVLIYWPIGDIGLLQ